MKARERPEPTFAMEVGHRVEELRTSLSPKPTQEAVAEALRLKRTVYIGKCQGVDSSWHLNELAALRAYFERQLGESLPGWPIIPIAQARTLAAVLNVARAAAPHVDGGAGDQGAIREAGADLVLEKLLRRLTKRNPARHAK